MPRRNSPHQIPDLGELSHLGDFVFDKRQDQRAAGKRRRRNRHYEKQFIRNTLAHLPSLDRVDRIEHAEIDEPVRAGPADHRPPRRDAS